MGGNAVSNAVRLEKQYYDFVADGTSTVLKEAFPEAIVSVIPAYREKESFGDLDILISGIDVGTLREFCEKVLNSPEVHTNSNVISFGLNITGLMFKRTIFQVDFITVPEEIHDFALKYFAFNDLGNLIGQTAHGIGLKFGHDGLWYKYIVDTQLVREICITQDFTEALEFLGYDPARYALGFDNLDAIFEYVITSPYFTTWNYLLENRNAVGRVRDKKRKTYMLFLDWLKGKTLNNERSPRDSGFIRILEKMEFPEAVKAYAIATMDYHRLNRVKKKINGTLISEWTGLTDRELGILFGNYRTLHGGLYWTTMDSMSAEEIEADVKKYFQEAYSKL
jgi:hypothetical protein